MYIEIEPYKLPKKLNNFLGRYLIYEKENKGKPWGKGFDEKLVRILLLIAGESVKLLVRITLFIYAKIFVLLKGRLENIDKYLD